MFRKPADAASTARSVLRNKEVKAVRDAVVRQMVPASTGPASASSALTPAFAEALKSLEESKLGGMDRHSLLLYSDATSHLPLLVNLDPKAGIGRLLPTVFALWKAPNLLPTLVVASPVSAFLLNGADLMLPGVLTRDPSSGALLFPRFEAGALLAIRVDGNPVPFAVGEALLSDRGCSSSGMRGRGVRLLHCYRDELWAVGSRISGGGYDVPNDGFLPSQVVACAVAAAASSDLLVGKVTGALSSAAGKVAGAVSSAAGKVTGAFSSATVLATPSLPAMAPAGSPAIAGVGELTAHSSIPSIADDTAAGVAATLSKVWLAPGCAATVAAPAANPVVTSCSDGELTAAGAAARVKEAAAATLDTSLSAGNTSSAASATLAACATLPCHHVSRIDVPTAEIVPTLVSGSDSRTPPAAAPGALPALIGAASPRAAPARTETGAHASSVPAFYPPQTPLQLLQTLSPDELLRATLYQALKRHLLPGLGGAPDASLAAASAPASGKARAAQPKPVPHPSSSAPPASADAACLPMLSSRLFGALMGAARPVGTELDVRRTQWKKTSAFFAAMQAEGLLGLECDVAKGTQTITVVTKTHPGFRAFKPWPAELEAGGSNGGGAGDSSDPIPGGGSNAAPVSGSPSVFRPVLIREYVRAPHAARPIFAAVAVEAISQGRRPLGVIVKDARGRRGRHSAILVGTATISAAVPVPRPAAAGAAVNGSPSAAGGASALLPRASGHGGDENPASDDDGSSDDDDDGSSDDGHESCVGDADTAAPSTPSKSAIPRGWRDLALLPSIGSVLYTAAEASAVLSSYIAFRGLANPSNKAVVTLDGWLADALSPGKRQPPLPSPPQPSTAADAHWPALGRALTQQQQQQHAAPPPSPRDPFAAWSGALGLPPLPPTPNHGNAAAGMRRSDLAQLWASRCGAQPSHTLTTRSHAAPTAAAAASASGSRGEETRVFNGAPPLITLAVRSLQGGRKHTTHISGLQHYGVEAAQLAREAARAFAASATVQPSVSNPANEEVMVQGDVAGALAAALCDWYGLPRAIVAGAAAAGGGGSGKAKKKG